MCIPNDELLKFVIKDQILDIILRNIFECVQLK